MCVRILGELFHAVLADYITCVRVVYVIMYGVYLRRTL